MGRKGGERSELGIGGGGLVGVWDTGGREVVMNGTRDEKKYRTWGEEEKPVAGYGMRQKVGLVNLCTVCTVHKLY